MTNEEMEKLIKEAVIWSKSASAMTGDNPQAASVSAQISIAKSLAVIAGILEKTTNGQASINVYDTSNPVI